MSFVLFSRFRSILSRAAFCAGALVVCCGPVRAQQPQNLLDAGAARVVMTEGAQGVFEPGAEVWRIVPPVRTGQGPRPEMRIGFAPRAALSKRTKLVFECGLRAAPEEGGGAAGQAGLFLEVAAGPEPVAGGGAEQPRVFFRHILLAGPEWETFLIPIEADGEAAEGQWHLALKPGHFDQPIEMRNVRLRPMRPGDQRMAGASYAGHEPWAKWRKTAAKRIAEHRMGAVEIEAMGRLGEPVAGARVTIEQTRHAYLFGTCVSAARLVDADVEFREPGMTREKFLADNERYRREFLRLFNYAVFENDLKWPMWDESRRNFSQNATLRAMEWLRERGIPAKGHTMMWASWRMTPSWLAELKGDKEALQAAILRHIRDVGAASAPFTMAWDVLNEPMSHRDIIELLGHGAVAEWFRTAREALPGQTLLLNEFDLVGNGGSPARRAGIAALVRDLKELGGAPDQIGCQAHFWSNRLTPPEKIWAILDELHEANGLPVAATEFDMNFPNDRLQADYTRDFLTAWFAHPATSSFIMWGFWGGAHWFGDRGAMFRRDWTPKPNLKAYEELVFKEWWTREEAVTDRKGRAVFRAFHGEHRVRIEAPGFEPAERRVVAGPGVTRLPVVLHPARTGGAAQE